MKGIREHRLLICWSLQVSLNKSDLFTLLADNLYFCWSYGFSGLEGAVFRQFINSLSNRPYSEMQI